MATERIGGRNGGVVGVHESSNSGPECRAASRIVSGFPFEKRRYIKQKGRGTKARPFLLRKPIRDPVRRKGLEMRKEVDDLLAALLGVVDGIVAALFDVLAGVDGGMVGDFEGVFCAVGGVGGDGLG